MPDYLRPGVFVQETLTPLPQPTLSAGEAIAAFVGTCAAGPSSPTLIQSWSDFLTFYRGFGDGTQLLPFSVYQFFQNGGRRAYIVRTISSDATTASLTIKNRPLLPSGAFGSGGFGSGGFGSGGSGGSGSSGFSTTTYSSLPPNPPTNLRLTGAPLATAVSLAWDPVSNSDGYNLYRGLGSATPVLVSPGPGQNTFFTDSPLLANNSYTYYVTAVNNIGETAKSAPLTTTTPPDPTIQVPALSVTAKSPGTFGNSIFIDILPGFTANRFHLQVKVGGATSASIVEKFQDVSLDPSDTRYVVGIVNSPSTGSQFITVANLMTGPVTLAWYPTEQVGTALSGGYDGSQPVNLTQTITELDNVDTILNINLPGVSDTTTINAIITWCQNRGNAFLVVDVPQTPTSTSAQAATTYLSLVPGSSSSTGQYSVSGYAAVYGPWLQVSDPAAQSRTAMRLLPPGGSVLGRYITADTQNGPQQVAAGAQFPLLNVLDVEHLFSNDQLDQLNQAGVNIIRPQSQVGLCIMGARTLNLGYPDRYIPVRRMLEYVEQVLVDATAFAVFKPNGPQLWAALDAICTTKLTAMAQLNMLAGATPNNSFFVQCDATNNTPATVAQGQVNLTVGVALASPAEFIIISIGQYAGNTTVTNSLTPSGANQ
jgi:hypothetical protein